VLCLLHSKNSSSSFGAFQIMIGLVFRSQVTDSKGANGTIEVAGERNGQPDKRVYVSFDGEAEKLMSE